MTIRKKNQRTGASAELIVQRKIDQHANWLSRTQGADFGVDLEAELTETIGEDELLKGKILKIQTKGTSEIRKSKNTIKFSLEVKYLSYICQLKVPVILVVVDIDSESAWYVWLQEWALRNEKVLYDKIDRKYIDVKIPIDCTLTSGLDGPLQDIARGRDRSAMVLSLRDIAIAAIDWNNLDILKGVLDILCSVHGDSRDWIVTKTIDGMIGLGPNVGTWRVSEYLPMLLGIAEKLGKDLTTEQIVRIVVRGDTFSSTALYALSKLYDMHFSSMISRNISKVFLEMGMFELYWYCCFREQHGERNSLQIWNDVKERRLGAVEFGPVRLRSGEQFLDYIWRKWPNRGDSVFLECLEMV